MFRTAIANVIHIIIAPNTLNAFLFVNPPINVLLLQILTSKIAFNGITNALATCAKSMISVGDAPIKHPAKTPKPRTIAMMMRNFVPLTFSPQPRIPQIGNAADSGAVRADLNPAAHHPSPNTTVAQFPKMGVNDSAMNLPFVISIPVP